MSVTRWCDGCRDKLLTHHPSLRLRHPDMPGAEFNFHRGAASRPQESPCLVAWLEESLEPDQEGAFS